MVILTKKKFGRKGSKPTRGKDKKRFEATRGVSPKSGPKLNKKKRIVVGGVGKDGFIEALKKNKDFTDVSQYVLSDVYEMVNEIDDDEKLLSLLKTRVYFETDRGFKWILSVLLPAYLQIKKELPDNPLQICNKDCFPKSEDSMHMDIFKKFICHDDNQETDRFFYAYQTGTARQKYFSGNHAGNENGFSSETLVGNIKHTYISHAKEAEYEAINFKDKFKSLFNRDALKLSLNDEEHEFKIFVSIGSTSTQAWKYKENDGNVEPIIIIPQQQQQQQHQQQQQQSNKEAQTQGRTNWELFGVTSETVLDDDIKAFIEILSATEGNILFFNAIGYQVLGGNDDQFKPPQKINTDGFIKPNTLLNKILNNIDDQMKSRIYVVPRKYLHPVDNKQIQISAEWVSALYEEKRYKYILDVGGGKTYLYTDGEKRKKGNETLKYTENDYIRTLCGHIQNIQGNIANELNEKVEKYKSNVNSYFRTQASAAASPPEAEDTEVSSAAEEAKTPTEEASPQEAGKEEVVVAKISNFFDEIDKELNYSPPNKVELSDNQ